ncbi:hypothetical protein GGF32_004008 [Allomyces javanicus]|nr:hypothetical protein GGF32_004008 [Allomyces javanicus]
MSPSTTATSRPSSATRALDLPQRIAELAADLPRTTSRAPSSARPRTAPPPSLTGHAILGVDPAPASPPRHAATAMHQVQGGGPCTTVPIRVSDEAMALWERQMIDDKHRSDLPLASQGLRDLRLPGVLVLDHQLRAAKDLMLTKIDRYPEIFADANDTMILAHLFLDQLLAPLTLFMVAKHQVLPAPDATHDLPAPLRSVLDENLDQAPLALQTARRFFDATVRLYQHLTHMTNYLRTFDQHLTSFASTIETLEEEHALYMQVVSQHSVAVDRIQVLTLSRYVDTRVPAPTRSVETSTDEPRAPILAGWTPTAARCANCRSPSNTDSADLTARFHGLLCADCATVLTAVTTTADSSTTADSDPHIGTVTAFRGTRLRVSVLDGGGASSRNTLNADDVGPHVSFAHDTAEAPPPPAPTPTPVVTTTTTTATAAAAAGHRKSVSGPATTASGARPATASASRKPAAATTAPAGGSTTTLANGKFVSTASGPDTPFARAESRASQTTAAAAADDAGKRGERRKTAAAVVPLGGPVPGGKALAAATAAALAAQEAEDASAALAAADARTAEDQVRRMQADVQAAETEVAHCRDKRTLALLSAALTSLSAQNAELSATVVAVQRERDALLAAKTDLARHLDDQRRANTALATAHDEGKRDLASARAQTCRAKEDAGAKDVLLKQACAEVDRVRRTCRAHERHIAALEAQLEAAQTSVQVLAKVPDVDTARLSAAAGSVGAEDADHVVEEVIAANNARIAALERKNDELRQWRLREVALHRPATARVLSSHPALALAAGVHLSMHGVEPMAADRGTDPPGRAASGAARVLAASTPSVDRLYGKTARARASTGAAPEQANRGTGTARWASSTGPRTGSARVGSAGGRPGSAAGRPGSGSTRSSAAGT